MARMLNRTMISAVRQHVGSEVIVSGWVDVRRDHGKLIFIDLRDVSGKVQMVALPNHEKAHTVASSLRPEWVVRVKGLVNKRPEKMVNKNEPNGGVELEIIEITNLAQAKELPFETGTEINIDTYLDHLPLTLRNSRQRAIFSIQAMLVQAYRTFLIQEGFTEFQAPKLIGEDAEGGANSFDVKYFKHTAHLAQSPQLYKQIMVGVYERVFTTGNVYRAEKHSTTRHLNEYTSLDLEMGFIEDHRDIMELEMRLLTYMFGEIKASLPSEIKLLGAEIPDVPKIIPSLKLREAQELIKKESSVDKTKAPDLDPEDERWLSEYALRIHKSDFIFITHFPTEKRPFYTYRDESDPTYTKGFDLLFRGVEITTGAQRIHDYDALVQSLNDKHLNPDTFSYYLQAFKYGMPPHGGLGMGLERLTQKLLRLANIKEACLFPRDLNRIDQLLSK